MAFAFSVPPSFKVFILTYHSSSFIFNSNVLEGIIKIFADLQPAQTAARRYTMNAQEHYLDADVPQLTTEEESAWVTDVLWWDEDEEGWYCSIARDEKRLECRVREWLVR